MNERLLQFIWQFQYFNKTDLLTINGEPVEIIHAGRYNRDQGPDFSDAKVRIGNTTWAGTTELHIRTSDWKKHRHQHDSNYDNVILHAVWEHDGYDNNIPVLELQGRVSGILLERYEQLMQTDRFIPCENLIGTVKEITWNSWKERLMAERLSRKAASFGELLRQSNYHWEESFWWLLAKNFGMHVNGEAFEAVARSISLQLLSKHSTQIQQLEALLMGQAGLLENEIAGDDYYKMLQKEYRFLAKKYKLKPVLQPVHFLRMRPVNFPTVRFAQLAALLHQSARLFTRTKETISLKELRSFFDVTANDYWHYHYRFGESSVFMKKQLGGAMIDNLVTNTMAPVLFAYGSYYNEERYKTRALDWLEQVGAETNHITKDFMELGIENRNAFDSQALIELKNEYCNKKRCLECGVGNALLKAN
jgi:hypothetical protein